MDRKNERVGKESKGREAREKISNLVKKREKRKETRVSLTVANRHPPINSKC